jgi:hypothetical protein
MLILGLYFTLGLMGMTEIGVVGEVAWTWMNGAADPNLAGGTQTDSNGLFVAANTRPMVAIRAGGFSLPLLINLYTGGLADWPARLVSPLGIGAVSVLHMVFGGLLIALVHRFLRFHATGLTATTAAFLLATDWVYIFHRRALGGTETLLAASSLLCLWALWSRRWAGGRHGLIALAAGVGLGLSAKFTFIFTLLALGLTALILRRDKPRLGPPLPDRWAPITAALFLPLLPLVVGFFVFALAQLPTLATHDHIQPQLQRIWGALSGGPRPARESLAALAAWTGNPLSFLSAAWGAKVPIWFSPLRTLGWALVAMGTAVAWFKPDATPRLALSRFCSVFLVLQVGIIWGVARDLHHLAVATPTLMIVAGLAFDNLAGLFAPHKSFLRRLAVVVFCMPWTWVNLLAISGTDTAMRSISRPTCSRSGQTAIIEMLTQNGATKVLTLDYESAGALDVDAPETRFIHGWPRIVTDRSSALEALLPLAVGGHLLVISDAPPWTYNLRPRPLALYKAAERAGVETVAVDRLPDDAAVLYAVGLQKGRP